jgi:hypothetical protein
MDPRVGLYGFREDKSGPAVQSVASHHTDYAISAPTSLSCLFQTVQKAVIKLFSNLNSCTMSTSLFSNLNPCTMSTSLCEIIS